MLPPTFTPEYLRNIEQLRLRSRRAFLGSRQGGHISLRRGHGIEFAEYRKYEPGDDPRRIDWGVYGRTDKLYVKRFREEEDMSVLIVIDCSSSMVTPPQDKKWESARDLAITLSYVALMQQDSLAISVPGAFHSPRYSGARAIHHLSSELVKLNKGYECDFRREMQVAVSRVRFPGKAILISDFLMELDTVRDTLNIMRARNLDITALQILGPHDIQPLSEIGQALALDSETGEEVEVIMDEETRAQYDAMLKEHNQGLRELCHSRQVSFAATRSDQSLLDFVIDNLTSIGLLR